MKPTPAPMYLVWTRGSGDPRRPENWRDATPLEVLSVMQQAFKKNLGKLATQFPDSPIRATSVWWTYLHAPGWRGIDLISARVRRCDPPPSNYTDSSISRR